MDELLVGRQPQLIEFFLDEILHGFDIMIGDLFDIFDALGVLQAEIQVNGPQGREVSGSEAFQLGQRQPAQGDKIFHLYPHPVSDQGAFAEIIGQRRCGAAVAPVHR